LYQIRPDLPCSFFVTLDPDGNNAKVENVAKGGSFVQVAGISNSVVRTVKVVRGKDSKHLSRTWTQKNSEDAGFFNCERQDCVSSRVLRQAPVFTPPWLAAAGLKMGTGAAARRSPRHWQEWRMFSVKVPLSKGLMGAERRHISFRETHDLSRLFGGCRQTHENLRLAVVIEARSSRTHFLDLSFGRICSTSTWKCEAVLQISTIVRV
jgi:hypothetical protein